MNLRKKLTLAIVVTGVIPAIIISAMAVRTTSFLEDEVGQSYEHEAESITDKLDRNLFERYGDVHVDDDIRKLYGSEGFALGFSAPVKDAEEKVIGVWHNVASYSLIEDLVTDAYSHFKASGAPKAEITIIDSRGRIIVDYDPEINGGKSTINTDSNIILKFNLAEKGLEPAKMTVQGDESRNREGEVKKRGVINSHARRRCGKFL